MLPYISFCCQEGSQRQNTAPNNVGMAPLRFLGFLLLLPVLFLGKKPALCLSEIILLLPKYRLHPHLKPKTH